MKKIAALLSLFMLGGCIPAVIGAGAAGGYYVGTDDRKAGDIASDASITSQINFKMVGDSRVSALHVDVDTYMGKVVLTGDVPNAESEQAVIDMAKSVRGVKSVESRLHVGDKQQ